MKHYVGNITPSQDTIFVFGSKPEGIHGAGAAAVAVRHFGAIYGIGEGLQGQSYALPTKGLRVLENNGLRSISPQNITAAVRRMYEVARKNQDKNFKIAFRNTDEVTLNGYSGWEMIDIFLAAGPMPENVWVSEEWFNTGKF